MCLGSRARLTAISEGIGRAKLGDLEMNVNLEFLPEARVGDRVLVHSGFGLRVVDERLGVRVDSDTPGDVDRWASEVEELADGLGDVLIMEVCGTHTVAAAKSGLRARLPGNIRLISGPGCPVCVTTTADVDTAVGLAMNPGVILVTFGDMMRVPGSRSSLEEAKAKGARVQVVYDLFSSLDVAEANPDHEVVVFSVGFETTAPMTAALVSRASDRMLPNLTVLSRHKLVPPAMEAVLSDPSCSLSGFICPGHVSTVTGLAPYERLAGRYAVPSVVAGFQPSDMVEAIVMILRQLTAGTSTAENQYRHVVTDQGNAQAALLMNDVFQVVNDGWRGLGTIPASGLRIRSRYGLFDAERRFTVRVDDIGDPAGCMCGSILRGLAEPGQCELFGQVCLPQNPVGPCMVSHEGTCQAHYLYQFSG